MAVLRRWGLDVVTPNVRRWADVMTASSTEDAHAFIEHLRARQLRDEQKRQAFELERAVKSMSENKREALSQGCVELGPRARACARAASCLTSSCCSRSPASRGSSVSAYARSNGSSPPELDERSWACAHVPCGMEADAQGADGMPRVGPALAF